MLFKITQLLSYLAILDELRASGHAANVWRQNRSLETKKVHTFHFLPTSIVS